MKRIFYLSTNFKRHITKQSSNLGRIQILTQKTDLIKTLLSDISIKLKIPALSQEFSTLQSTVEEETWSESNIEVLKKISKIGATIQYHQKFQNSLTENIDLIQMAVQENDLSLIDEITSDVETLKSDVDKYLLHTLFTSPTDKLNCFIEIHSGAGGHESNDFALLLSKMYLQWAKENSFVSSIVEETPGELTGYRSIMIRISGEYAYGWCKFETGVHRLVRVSEFDKEKRRQTSFASVSVIPDNNDISSGLSSKNIELNSADLKIETMRSQGAGGQHVNTTDSAVRVTHLPSGIVAFVSLLLI